MTTVQWPQSPVSDGADVLAPLTTLLVGLNVLEDAEDAANPTFWKTPYSLQVITAGASASSKWVGSVVASLGGAAGIGAGITALQKGLETSLKIGYASAAAACIVATVLALAIVVKSDIAGRAQAASAEYHARAAVAGEYLRNARPQGEYVVKQPGYGNPFVPVQSFKLADGDIVVALADGSTLKGEQVEGLLSMPR